jgi:curved DNA-binding protein CbpA
MRRSGPGVTEDPFRALGLPPRADLNDDDVRVAWRRIAAATHPDRDDGGDPAVFGAAAAAYAQLRIGYGRTEALADLGSRDSRGRRQARGWRGSRGGRLSRGPRGVRDGRPGRPGRPGLLALRLLAAAGVSAFAFAAGGWAPATVGVLTGAVTWLAATARYDFPRRSRD